MCSSILQTLGKRKLENLPSYFSHLSFYSQSLWQCWSGWFNLKNLPTAPFALTVSFPKYFMVVIQTLSTCLIWSNFHVSLSHWRSTTVFLETRDYLVSCSRTEMYSHDCIQILLFLFHFVPCIRHFLLHIVLFIRNPQYKEIIYAVNLFIFPIEKTRRPVRRHFTAHFDRDNVATRQVSLQNLYSRLVEMAEVTWVNIVTFS